MLLPPLIIIIIVIFLSASQKKKSKNIFRPDMEGILEKMGTGVVASVAHRRQYPQILVKNQANLTLLLLVEYSSSNTDYGTTHKRNSKYTTLFVPGQLNVTPKRSCAAVILNPLSYINPYLNVTNHLPHPFKLFIFLFTFL